MTYRFIPLLWLFILSVIISGTLLYYTCRNRRVAGVPFFIVTILLAMLWTVAQALEISAGELSRKIWWDNLQFISITFAPVSLLLMVMKLIGRELWPTKPWLYIPLISVPIFTNILIWTNHLHGLIRRHVFLDTSGWFPVVGVTYGSAFWVFVYYNVTLCVVICLILVEAQRTRTNLYRGQILVLLVGLLLPFLSNLVYLSDLFRLGFDLTPLVFGLSGMIIFFGLFHYRLWDVVPVARSAIVEGMGTAIIVVDGRGRVIDLNQTTTHILGVSSKNILGQPADKLLDIYPAMRQLYDRGCPATGELNLQKIGGDRFYGFSFTQLDDHRGRFLGRLILINDITEQKKTEEIIRHLAYHDFLTGLPSRKLLEEFFSRELVQSIRNHDLLGVAFIDLDDFKQINDQYGHEVGDRFLCEAADRLSRVLRKSDTVSRHGGDEFIVLLPGMEELSDFETIAGKIYQTFESPVLVDHHALFVKASIGFSCYPRDGDTLETLIKKSDTAMYLAKKSGKNTYRIYSGEE